MPVVQRPLRGHFLFFGAQKVYPSNPTSAMNQDLLPPCGKNRINAATLLASVLLCACGAGDSPSEPQAEPPPAALQAEASPQIVSMAQSLPAPPPVAAPVLAAVPPAPDERPLRAPAAQKRAHSDREQVPPLSVLRQVVQTGLSQPTDLAFASDGVMFYTDFRQGLFAKHRREAAALVDVSGDAQTAHWHGALSVAVDPDFVRNRQVFVLFASKPAGYRIAKLKLNAAMTRATSSIDILRIDTDTEKINGGVADAGCRIRFGADGFLYVGLCQGLSLAGPLPTGAVLRIDREGKAASGNRSPAGLDERVLADGFRQQAGLAFHPQTGTLLVAERQTEGWEALAWVTPGSTRPVVVWRNNTPREGMTGIDRLRLPLWKDWRNALAVTFEGGRRIAVIKLDGKGRMAAEVDLALNQGTGFRAMAEGPDGLYVVTLGKGSGEEIWRIAPL